MRTEYITNIWRSGDEDEVVNLDHQVGDEFDMIELYIYGPVTVYYQNSLLLICKKQGEVLPVISGYFPNIWLVFKTRKKYCVCKTAHVFCCDVTCNPDNTLIVARCGVFYGKNMHIGINIRAEIISIMGDCSKFVIPKEARVVEVGVGADEVILLQWEAPEILIDTPITEDQLELLSLDNLIGHLAPSGVTVYVTGNATHDECIKTLPPCVTTLVMDLCVKHNHPKTINGYILFSDIKIPNFVAIVKCSDTMCTLDWCGKYVKNLVFKTNTYNSTIYILKSNAANITIKNSNSFVVVCPGSSNITSHDVDILRDGPLTGTNTLSNCYISDSPTVLKMSVTGRLLK